MFCYNGLIQQIEELVLPEVSYPVGFEARKLLHRLFIECQMMAGKEERFSWQRAIELGLLSEAAMIEFNNEIQDERNRNKNKLIYG